jgi:ketosteroid isomerase-like protein
MRPAGFFRIAADPLYNCVEVALHETCKWNASIHTPENEMSRQKTLLIVGLAGLFIAQELLLAQSSASADAKAIRTARIVQNAAMAAGDVDKAATWWTDDVTIRRGLGTGITGIEGYKGILERAPVSDTALVYQRRTTDVTVSNAWPLAFETGSWTARVGGTGPALIAGRYSAQWVKRDGKWLIRSEVFVALTCSGQGCASKAAP